MERTREEELKETPMRQANPKAWPKGVRSIALGEMDSLGVDRQGILYWDGHPVVVQKGIKLSVWQTIGAVIVAIGAIGSVAQGFTSYNEWACKVGWSAIVCPPNASSK